jgi:hypothetical protein
MRYPVLALVLLTGCAASGPASGPAPSSADVQHSTRVAAGTGEIEMITGGGERQGVRREVIGASVEQIWAALPAAFEGLGIESGVVDAAGHVYGNPAARATRRIAGHDASFYLDCGLDPLGTRRADKDVLQVTALAYPVPAGQTTSTLVVQVRGLASQPSTGTRSDCISTGRLEQRIVEAVKAALPAA